MCDNSLFMVSHPNVSFRYQKWIRLGVITDNQYLLMGIRSMVCCNAALNEGIEVVSLTPEQWKTALVCCDFIITDHRTKCGIFLLPAKYDPECQFSGYDIKPESLSNVLHHVVNGECHQFTFHSVLSTAVNDFTPREVEMLTLLSGHMSKKEIIESGRFNVKDISRYKQKIKKKVYCHSDSDFFSALALMKQIS